MCDFEYMLSIARGFAVPEEEARKAAADAVAGRAPTTPQQDAAAGATAGKLRIHRPAPPRRAAS